MTGFDMLMMNARTFWNTSPGFSRLLLVVFVVCAWGAYECTADNIAIMARGGCWIEWQRAGANPFDQFDAASHVRRCTSGYYVIDYLATALWMTLTIPVAMVVVRWIWRGFRNPLGERII
jgi:hypothetical protein